MEIPFWILITAYVLIFTLFFLLRSFTRNHWIKKRLRLSLFLMLVATVLEVVNYYSYAPAYYLTTLRTVEYLVAAVAFIAASVSLIFNRFTRDRVSDKYPAIVQDAIVIGSFLLIVAYLAPEQFLVTSAVGGLVIGLALQDTLGNLFAGLALQLEKPFFVGDWVHVAQLEGRVLEVTWRATKIRTKSGNFIIIPNSNISKDNIINYTHPSPILRMEKVIGFGYEAHPNRVREVVTQTLQDVPDILKEPAPDVLLNEYSDFSINYRCRYWIDDFGRSEPIANQFTTLLYYRLQRAGLKIPFPIRDVRMTQQEEPVTPWKTLPDRRLEYVEKVDLFVELNADDKHAIAQTMEQITYAADEPIVRQDEEGDSMFFIATGKVRIILDTDGVSNQVAVLEPGQYFGEMALLTGEKRAATAVAASDVDAYVLRKDTFREVLLKEPEIAHRISEVMAKRRDSLEEITAEVVASRPVQRETQKTLLGKIRNFFGL